MKENRFYKGNGKTNQKLISNLVTTISGIMSRRGEIAQGLGLSYNTKRDLYKAMGYVREPEFRHYWNQYMRNAIAKRIVNAYPEACWREHPVISEVEGKETAFEEAWKKLTKTNKIFHYLTRADKLACVGEFSVLFVGVDDGNTDLSRPIGKATELLYLQPYKQQDVQITQWNVDTRDKRYGLPHMYELTQHHLSSTDNVRGSTLNKIVVHHSRIIHVVEEPLDNNVYGIPKLLSMLNMLQNLELVASSSAEMFYRGAFFGLVFNADSDAQMDADQTSSEMSEEIEAYFNDFQRHLKLQGIEVKQLNPTVVTPNKHIEAYIDQIAASAGIPKRILIGSERGELASNQDEQAWNNRVSYRQLNVCEPGILRPFIDKMIEIEILPAPEDNYEISWQSPYEPSDKEKADVAKTRAEAIATFVNALGADQVVPVEMFLEKYMGFMKEEIEYAKKLVLSGSQIDKEGDKEGDKESIDE